MRAYLEAQYGVRVIQWDEPTEDGGVVFTVLHEGRWVTADSARLILATLQDATARPLVLRAA